MQRDAVGAEVIEQSKKIIAQEEESVRSRIDTKGMSAEFESRRIFTLKKRSFEFHSSGDIPEWCRIESTSLNEECFFEIQFSLLSPIRYVFQMSSSEAAFLMKTWIYFCQLLLIRVRA